MDSNIRLIGFASGIRAVGVSMVYPFVTIYLNRVLHVPFLEIGFLLVLVGVPPLLFAPVGGLITDRAGRRKIILIGLAAESASVALIGYSMLNSFLPGVLLFAAVSGVTGSLAGPAVSAYVADMTEGSDRSLGFTWLRIGFNAGFTVGVGLGGFLIGYLGYPTVGFISGAVLMVGVLVLIARLAPSSYDIARSSGAHVVGGSSAGPVGPGSVRNSFAILAKDGRFLVFCVASMISALVYSQWSTTFPLFVGSVLGLPTGILGVALALNGAIVIFGQNPTTRLMIGKRQTTSAILGVILFGLAFIALGAASLFSLALLAVFAFVVILTVGENLGAIPSMTLPSNLAPATEIGSYNGAYNTLSGIGGIFAPLAGGLALSASGNTLFIWGILALPTIPAVLLFLWVGRKIPPKANTV